MNFGWLNNIYSWFIDPFINTKDHELQQLLFSTALAVLIVFFIEWLRKPRVKVRVLDRDYEFDMPHGTGSIARKFVIKYKRSLLNIFIPYPLNNLKAVVNIYNLNYKQICSFQAKPDCNPEPIDTSFIPFSLDKINLTKGEQETFPFLTFRRRHDGRKYWLCFNLWPVYSYQNEDDFILTNDKYYMKINIVSDQIRKTFYENFILNNEKYEVASLNLFQKIKFRIKT